MTSFDQSTIDASKALGEHASLNQAFNIKGKDVPTQTVTLKEDLKLTKPDGTEVTLPANTEITFQNPSNKGNDGFLATGDKSPSQHPINREISHEGYKKMGWKIAQGTAQAKNMAHEVGEGSSFIMSEDGAFPEGAKLSDGTDLSGYKMNVPEGTDVVQMVEVGGKAVMLPIDLDKLNVDGSATEVINEKKGKTVTYKAAEFDKGGEFLKQYDGLKDLGLDDDAIKDLADDAREIKDSEEYSTAASELDVKDMINKGIDAIKDGNIPEIPKVPGG